MRMHENETEHLLTYKTTQDRLMSALKASLLS